MTDRSRYAEITVNDLAVCLGAAGLAIAWYKKGPHSRTKFVKGRIAELEAMNTKISHILDQFTPPSEGGEVPDNGEDAIALRWLRRSSTAA